MTTLEKNHVFNCSKPSKRLESFLESRRTFIHCSSDRKIPRDVLENLIVKIKSGEIETYELEELHE